MTLATSTLHTTRLLLRPFTEADVEAIFALQSNPDVLRYWDAPPWKERSQPGAMGADERHHYGP